MAFGADLAREIGFVFVNSSSRTLDAARTRAVSRPNPVEGFGDHPEPNHEVARQILRLLIAKKELVGLADGLRESA
jgi:hypothetical protein